MVALVSLVMMTTPFFRGNYKPEHNTFVPQRTHAHTPALAAMLASQTPRSLLRGDVSTRRVDYIPFDTAHMNRIQRMFEWDPQLRAGVGALVAILANAVIDIDSEDDPNAVEPTREMLEYIREHYTPLIEPMLRSLLLFGFVGIVKSKTRHRTKSERVAIPSVVNENLYTPGVRVKKRKYVSYVALDPITGSVDNDIMVVGATQPRVDGAISSTVSPLLYGFELTQQVQSASLQMDRLASQYMLVCEENVAASKEEKDLSIIGPDDLFAAEFQKDEALAEANVHLFQGHQEMLTDINLRNGIIPPALYPIPRKYKVTNPTHATTRTDAAALMLARRSEVLAVLGVPESLVFSGAQHAPSVIAAYRIMNATVSQWCTTLEKIVGEVHSFLHPEDPPVRFALNVSGMIAVENLEIAYDRDMLTPEEYGKYLLQAAHIPPSALNEAVKQKDFKLKRIAAQAKAEAAPVIEHAEGEKKRKMDEAEPRVGGATDGGAARKKAAKDMAVGKT